MLILAHRGVHHEHRENTLAAFEAANAVADGVELDVRRTADGVLVVHHDAALPDGSLIAHTPHAELPAWLPTLAAALAACRGMVDVEIKASPLDAGYDPAIATETLAAIQERPATIVTSFNVNVLPPGAGWLTLPGYDQFEAVETACARGLGAIAPPVAATTPDLIDAAHAAGLQVAVWTVNDPALLAGLRGVDIVITDHPARLRAAL